MIELAGIIILGILAQWVAWKFKIPAILPLILIGLLVGPIAAEYLSDNGNKWIEPIWNGTRGLFPGESLYYFVSLAISIILFEGGLTLKRDEVKNVGPVITKLITLGSAITFFGGGIITHFVFNLGWELSFLFSALIIVTGPTVITPILRNIPLKKDVSAVLKWEGILIDPIGALVAVLVFEFISVGGGGGFTKTALIEFGKILLFGTTFGFTFAHALAFAINKKLVPHYLLNVVSLSTVLLVFVESEIFAHESGLLAVVVMGMVLGNSKLKNIKELLYFKESLSILLISMLFILLAANINMSDLMLLYTWKSLILFTLIVFLIRPIAVLFCTTKSKLKFNEKLFISWVGPRGIVAAGIASLFGGKLIKQGVEGAEYITPLVFMIVLGTVLLNATTARVFAKLVGVFVKNSEGVLIIGASKLSRLIATYLQENNRDVVLIDNNEENVSLSLDQGLKALNIDVFSNELDDDIELNNVGYLLTITGSSNINSSAVTKFKNQYGENGVFRIRTNGEVEKNTKDNGCLFPINHDFISLSNIAMKYPHIQEVELTDKKQFNDLIHLLESNDNTSSLFIKTKSGDLDVIANISDEREITTGMKLVYLGKKID
jgi:NhaP-type Na+/H+ or K+/H+ antiporter